VGGAFQPRETNPNTSRRRVSRKGRRFDRFTAGKHAKDKRKIEVIGRRLEIFFLGGRCVIGAKTPADRRTGADRVLANAATAASVFHCPAYYLKSSIGNRKS
jgi:hypothetical protein